ncbi:7119_t:CDS:2, partial [Gigaspora rosea]
TPSRQNYHHHSATPPCQNYHCRSITSSRYSCQINRNYRDIEIRSHRSISPNKHSCSRRQSMSPDEKDKEISFLKSTVESLINEVNKLKSNKATTSNDSSEYVDVDDTETTGIMGTTGLSYPMDNMGFCDLDADETTVAPCDANETTVTPCDNTNSAIATSSVNP